MSVGHAFALDGSGKKGSKFWSRKEMESSNPLHVEVYKEGMEVPSAKKPWFKSPKFLAFAGLVVVGAAVGVGVGVGVFGNKGNDVEFCESPAGFQEQVMLDNTVSVLKYKIRNDHVDLCLTNANGVLEMDECDELNSSQFWVVSEADRMIHDGKGACLDLSQTSGPIISSCDKPGDLTAIVASNGRIVNPNNGLCINVFLNPVGQVSTVIFVPGDECGAVDEEQHLTLIPYESAKLQNRASGLCISHGGLNSNLELVDCANAATWIVDADQGRLKSDNDLCLDFVNSVRPRMTACSSLATSQEEIWLNQHGRFSTTNRRCLFVDASKREVKFNGICQAKDDSQSISQIPIAGTLQGVCGASSGKCLTHHRQLGSLTMEPCQESLGPQQDWVLDAGRVTSGGYCIDPTSSPEPRVKPCASVPSQGNNVRANFKDFQIQYPGMDKCLVVSSSGKVVWESGSICKDYGAVVKPVLVNCYNTTTPDDCCTTSAPCGEGRGSCQSDDDCVGSLVCGAPGSCIAQYSWGSFTERCCMPDEVKTCAVSTYSELVSQINERCPTGIIEVISETITFDGPISIVVGKQIEIRGADELNPPNMVMNGPADSYFFEVYGQLTLSHFNFTNPNGGGVRIRGETALADVDFCDFDVQGSAIVTDENATASISATSMLSQNPNKSAMKTCKDCSISMLNSKMHKLDLGTAQIAGGANSMILQNLHVQLDDALLLDNTRRRLQQASGVIDTTDVTVLDVRDRRKVYKSYLNCTNTTLLGSYEEDKPSDCVKTCDDEDDCVGVYWELANTGVCSSQEECDIVFNETIQNENSTMPGNASTCYMYEMVDVSSCIEYDFFQHSIRPDVYRVVDSSGEFDTYLEAYSTVNENDVADLCIASSDVIAFIEDVPSAQMCRVWCKYHAPLCKAVEFNHQDKTCLLGSDLTWIEGSDLQCHWTSKQPYILPPQDEFLRVSPACTKQVGANYLRGIRNSVVGCGTFCEMQGENCIGIEVDPEEKDCRLLSTDALLAELFTDRCRQKVVGQTNLTYELRIPASSTFFQFPKNQFIDHINAVENYCSHGNTIDIGEEMKTQRGSTTFENCKLKCAELPGCASILLTDFDGERYTCIFKDSASYGPCTTGEFLLLRSNTTRFNPVEEDAITIPDAIVEPNMTFASCRVGCWLDSSCEMFAFDAKNDNTCIFQSPSSALSHSLVPFEAGNLTVYESNVRIFNVTFQQYFKYSGQIYMYGALSTLESDTAQECNLLCTHNVLCRIWRFNPQSKSCEMFRNANIDSVAPTPTVSDLHVSSLDFRFEVAGSRQREYLNLSDTVEPFGAPLHYDDLEDITNYHDCLALCEMFRRCNVVTYSNVSNSCELYERFQARLATSVYDYETDPTVFLADSDYEFEQIPVGFSLLAVEIKTLTLKTLEECKHECVHGFENSVERCQSIQYDYNTATCHLHRGLELALGSIPSTSTIFRSVSKFRDEEVSFVNVTKDACPVDLEDAIISETNGTSLNLCERHCELEDKCLAILYDESTKTCSLLDSSMYTNTETCAGTMMIKYIADKFTDLAQNCPGGTLLITVAESTLNECSIICDALLDCKAFTINESTEECKLYDSPWSELRNNTCPEDENLYVEHSDMYYTADEFVTPVGETLVRLCGANPLPNDVQPVNALMELDECKALCMAMHPTCHGFNYDRSTMECVLQGKLEDATCSQMSNGNCACSATTTLYVVFQGGFTRGHFGFKYIPNRYCHGASALSGNGLNVSGSLEFCKRQCSLLEKCHSVSRDGDSGLCVFGDNDFDDTQACDDVFIKIPINRFGELLDVTINPAHVNQKYYDKSKAECQALCNAKADCIDVFRPVSCPTAAPKRPVCELSTSKAYTVSGDDTNLDYCTSIPANQRDVSVLKARHLFTPASTICTGNVNVLSSTDGVLDSEDCADLCMLNSTCRGFEFSLATTVLSSDSCTLYTNKTTEAAMYSCGAPTSGSFFRRSNVNLQTLDESELNARIWLRDPSARVGKALYKEVSRLIRTADSKSQTLEEAAVVTSSTIATLGVLEGTVSTVAEMTTGVAFAMQGLNFVMIVAAGAFGAIPYVGPAIKAAISAFRMIWNAAAKLVGRVKTVAKAGERPLSRSMAPLSKFDGLIAAAAAMVLIVPATMKTLAFVLIGAHKCAFQQGDMEMVLQIEILMEELTNIAVFIGEKLAIIQGNMINFVQGFEVNLENIMNIMNPISGFFANFRPLVDALKIPEIQFIAEPLFYMPFIYIPIPFFPFFPPIFFWRGGEMTIFDIIGAVLGGFIDFIMWVLEQLGFVDWLVSQILPSIGLDIPILQSPWGALNIDFDTPYNDLLANMQFPFTAMDEFREKLKNLSFDLPCDFGKEMDELLQEDDDDEAARTEGAATAGRVLGLSDSDKTFGSERNIIPRLLEKLATPKASDGNDREDDRDRGSNRRRRKGDAAKAVMASKPVVFSSIAHVFAHMGTMDAADPTSLRYKVSMNVAVKEKMESGERKYIKLGYKINNNDPGVHCYLGVNPKTNKPTRLSSLTKSPKQTIVQMFTEGVDSHKLYMVEFFPSPETNPWASDSWDFKAYTKLVDRLPSGLLDSCDECPIGAKCKRAAGNWNSLDPETDTKNVEPKSTPIYSVARGKTLVTGSLPLPSPANKGPVLTIGAEPELGPGTDALFLKKAIGMCTARVSSNRNWWSNLDGLTETTKTNFYDTLCTKRDVKQLLETLNTNSVECEPRKLEGETIGACASTPPKSFDTTPKGSAWVVMRIPTSDPADSEIEVQSGKYMFSEMAVVSAKWKHDLLVMKKSNQVKEMKEEISKVLGTEVIRNVEIVTKLCGEGQDALMMNSAKITEAMGICMALVNPSSAVMKLIANWDDGPESGRRRLDMVDQLKFPLRNQGGRFLRRRSLADNREIVRDSFTLPTDDEFAKAVMSDEYDPTDTPELIAAKLYTDKDNNLYFEMNKDMRANRERSRFKSYAKILDSYLTNQTALLTQGKPIGNTLFRGLTLPKDFVTDKVFDAWQFLSTSENEEVAIRFACDSIGRDTGTKRVILKIHTDKVSPGSMPRQLTEISAFKDEKEFLFRPASMFTKQGGLIKKAEFYCFKRTDYASQIKMKTLNAFEIYEVKFDGEVHGDYEDFLI